MSVDSAIGTAGAATTPGPQNTPFTSHELLYLLTVSDSPAAAETRRRLMLPDGPDADAVSALGAATLLVRGLATLDGENIELTQESLFMAWLCADARSWIEVGLATTDKIDGFLIVVDPIAALIFTPSVLGIYNVLAMDEVAAIGDFVSSVLSGFLSAPGARSAIVRRHRPDGSNGLSVRLLNGSWEVGDEVTEPDGTTTVPRTTAADPAEISDQIHQLLA